MTSPNWQPPSRKPSLQQDTSWRPRPEPTGVLEELPQDRRPEGASLPLWMLLAFVLGVISVGVVGLSTDLFDSGPTDLDVSTAYREGYDTGEVGAQAEWEARLDDIWREHYDEGYEVGNSMAPEIQRAVIDGFSWEGGYEIGRASVERGVDASYWQGWMAGYQHGRDLVDGKLTSGSGMPGVKWGGDT